MEPRAGEKPRASAADSDVSPLTGSARLRANAARAIALTLALLLVGCISAPRRGVTHIVKPGENLYRISQHYGVSVESIRRANGIRDVRNLQVGTRLRSPRARQEAARKTLSAPAVGNTPSGGGGRARAKREANLHFVWPVNGRVSSGFGRRNGRNHQGIDIPAKQGTPIYAAEAGRVIHSGRGLGDYGKVVIVKHAGRYSTVYAHNRKIFVDKGEFVEKGQLIAHVGKTGNASGSHLHFELRRDRKPQNPRSYLP